MGYSDLCVTLVNPRFTLCLALETPCGNHDWQTLASLWGPIKLTNNTKRRLYFRELNNGSPQVPGSKYQPKEEVFGRMPPADIRQKFGQAPQILKKNKHCGADAPCGRPRENFGLRNFGLIFRSLDPIRCRILGLVFITAAHFAFRKG